MDGAQTGGKRSSKTMPQSANPDNTEEQQVAYEGTLASRSFDDDTKQGVTTAPSSKEAEEQRKVVAQREDAQAGVNHSDKIPKRLGRDSLSSRSVAVRANREHSSRIQFHWTGRKRSHHD